MCHFTGNEARFVLDINVESFQKVTSQRGYFYWFSWPKVCQPQFFCQVENSSKTRRPSFRKPRFFMTLRVITKHLFHFFIRKQTLTKLTRLGRHPFISNRKCFFHRSIQPVAYSLTTNLCGQIIIQNLSLKLLQHVEHKFQSPRIAHCCCVKQWLIFKISCHRISF